jgi:hypothetical protein
MKVQVDYYNLKNEKEMGDGSSISKNQELILIKKDDNDGLLFFETYDDFNKKLFWTNADDVEFVRTLYEDWEEEKVEERNRYINGEFL